MNGHDFSSGTTSVNVESKRCQIPTADAITCLALALCYGIRAPKNPSPIDCSTKAPYDFRSHAKSLLITMINFLNYATVNPFGVFFSFTPHYSQSPIQVFPSNINTTPIHDAGVIWCVGADTVLALLGHSF